MSILQRLGQRVKSLALRSGVVVKRSNYYSRDDLRLLRFLELNDIDTVLDVGANRWDYAAGLFESGFKGRIWSFEPLPDMHDILVKRAAAKPGAWNIAPRCAIADKDGMARFHVTAAATGSSLLPPSGFVDGMADLLTVDSVIDVPTRTIADECEKLGIMSNRLFLKLDIQGGEEAALKGAEPLLPRVSGMVVEMPLRVYYEGQALARALDDWITDRGYELWDIVPAWRNRETGRLDYIDATYFQRTSSR